jgi:methyltransferase
MSSVTVATTGTLVVLAIMLAETWLSRAHERTLRAQGAVEPPGDVYRTMQWVYPASFVAMGVEGAFFGSQPGTVALCGIVLLAMAKALKFWAMATLGYRWTFRVLVPPGAPRVRRGPYAFTHHPNYVAVIGEIVAFGVLVGSPFTGVLSLVGFGALLRRRIRLEERALGGGVY